MFICEVYSEMYRMIFNKMLSTLNNYIPININRQSDKILNRKLMIVNITFYLKNDQISATGPIHRKVKIHLKDVF